MASKRETELFNSMRKYVDDLAGLEKVLVEDMVRTYCWYATKVEELQRQIDRDGEVIETPRGPRPNPANTPLHQYTQRKESCFKSIQKVLSSTDVVAGDRLAAFVAR